MRLGNSFNVDDDYKERVLMMSKTSEGFIKGQLELINNYGFRPSSLELQIF